MSETDSEQSDDPVDVSTGELASDEPTDTFSSVVLSPLLNLFDRFKSGWSWPFNDLPTNKCEVN